MAEEGPLLESLTRRLAETPPDFLAEPRLGAAGVVHVDAVAADLLRALGGGPLAAAEVAQLRPPAREARTQRRRLRVVLLACWLLHDPWFAARSMGDGARAFLFSPELQALAEAADAPRIVADPDRREELARLCLKVLGLRPAGESEAQAQDRLTTISTAERQRVIAAARAAEERARQIREAMARQAAEEAADKWSRE